MQPPKRLPNTLLMRNEEHGRRATCRRSSVALTCSGRSIGSEQCLFKISTSPFWRSVRPQFLPSASRNWIGSREDGAGAGRISAITWRAPAPGVPAVQPGAVRAPRARGLAKLSAALIALTARLALLVRFTISRNTDGRSIGRSRGLAPFSLVNVNGCPAVDSRVVRTERQQAALAGECVHRRDDRQLLGYCQLDDPSPHDGTIEIRVRCHKHRVHMRPSYCREGVI